MFWLLLVVLTLMAAMFIALPLLKPGVGARVASPRRASFNASLYEAEFAELDSLRQAGAISEEHYQERHNELSHRLVADAGTDDDVTVADDGPSAHPVLVVVLLCALPLAAGMLYQYLGSWHAHRMAVQVEQVLQPASGERPDANELMSLLGDLARFNQGQEQPDWLFVQARTAMQVGAYPAAAALFARLSQIEPANADILGWQAQALFLARGRTLDPEVEGVIERTLQINPHQSTVLGIRGMNAFENGDYALAARSWGQALAGVPPGSPSATMFQRGIEQANVALAAKGGGNVAGGAQSPHGDGAPTAASAIDASAIDASEEGGFSVGIKVSVALDGAARVAPGATVFVIASAPGGGMPYAVVRLPVEALPTEVLLDDSSAMAPGHSLSRQREVKITARVSQSGNAIGQAGDWQGRSEVMTPGTVPPVVAIQIDQQI